MLHILRNCTKGKRKKKAWFQIDLEKMSFQSISILLYSGRKNKNNQLCMCLSEKFNLSAGLLLLCLQVKQARRHMASSHIISFDFLLLGKELITRTYAVIYNPDYKVLHNSSYTWPEPNKNTSIDRKLGPKSRYFNPKPTLIRNA